jgi:APA family basic amino acid/polyamine antiporter
VPWSPVLPVLGVLFAVYLMVDLPLSTWIRFVGWLAAGIAIYALYGYRHSRLRTPGGDATPSRPAEPGPETPPGDPR